MRQSLRDLAKFHADRRGYADPEEYESYITGFGYGWHGDETKAPNIVQPGMPNAYSAGYWEGVHRKEKAELQ